MGDVLNAQGDLAGALKKLPRCPRNQQEAGQPETQAMLSGSAISVGQLPQNGRYLPNAQGGLDGALKAYRDGLAISEKLASQDPTNAGQQRDLCGTYDKVGDVLNAQGDQIGAQKSHRDGLAIREKLAGQDPSNADWERDLLVGCDKVGDVLNAQGDLGGALKSVIAIRLQLAKNWPTKTLSNADWRRDLSVSWRLHSRNGAPPN